VNVESDLRQRLRLIVLTRPRPAAGRLERVVYEILEAGCPAIQLRDKESPASELFRQAVALRKLTSSFEALLFVDDRFDVALAAGADGVHLGPEDLPVKGVRKAAPRPFLVGYSTDDPAAGARAARDGADYLGVGAVYGTRSKPGLQGEAVGAERVAKVRRAAGIPCVGIGGITPSNAGAVAADGSGVAVMSAVMDAERPGAVVRQLLEEIGRAFPSASQPTSDDI